QGTSFPRGMPRTPTPATGRPSSSRTTPSTTARGLAATRRVASVTFGAEEQSERRSAALVTRVVSRRRDTVKRRRSDLDSMLTVTFRGSRLFPEYHASMSDAQTHRFEVSASWSGDGAGRGEVRVGDTVAV